MFKISKLWRRSLAENAFPTREAERYRETSSLVEKEEAGISESLDNVNHVFYWPPDVHLHREKKQGASAAPKKKEQKRKRKHCVSKSTKRKRQKEEKKVFCVSFDVPSL